MSAKPINAAVILDEAYRRLYVLGETVGDAVLAEEVLQLGEAMEKLMAAAKGSLPILTEGVTNSPTQPMREDAEARRAAVVDALAGVGGDA